MKSLFIPLCTVLLFYSVSIASSCCGLGSTSASMGAPVIEHGSLLIRPTFASSSIRQNDLKRKDLGLLLGYGFNKRLSSTFSVRYAFLEGSLFRNGLFDTSTTGIIDTIKPDTTFHLENSGIGDGSLGIQFILLPFTLFTKSEITAGIDLLIPFGKTGTTATIDGMSTELPENIQSGGGTFGFSVYSTARKAIPEYYLQFSTQLGAMINFKNIYDKQPGNTYSGAVGTRIGPIYNFNIGLGILGSSTSMSLSEDKTPIDQTGNRKLVFTGNIDYSPIEQLSLSSSISLPITGDVNQKNHGEAFSF